MKTKALSREDRKRQILLVFAVEMNGGEIAEKTVNDIARKMHLSASGKLRDMVMELVIEGVLAFRDEAIPGVTKYRRIYRLNEKSYHRPKPQYKGQSRTVKVNSRQQSFSLEIGE